MFEFLPLNAIPLELGQEYHAIDDLADFFLKIVKI